MVGSYRRDCLSRSPIQPFYRREAGAPPAYRYTIHCSASRPLKAVTGVTLSSTPARPVIRICHALHYRGPHRESTDFGSRIGALPALRGAGARPNKDVVLHPHIAKYHFCRQPGIPQPRQAIR